MKGGNRIKVSEEEAWLDLTPDERYLESFKLFEYYVKTGGSLAPETDSQSPFHFPEYYQESRVA